jgi:HK97 family phage prohead protease
MTVTRLTLDGLVTAADQSARKITGRVVQYGAVGNTSAGPVRFVAGSLPAADPSRIKLLVDHDSGRLVGHASDVRDVDGHLEATFDIADGPDGDEALRSAARRDRDGLSVGAEILESVDADDGVLEVTAAAWRETSLVGVPAFRESFVTQVAASTPPPPVPPRAAAALPVVFAASRRPAVRAASWDGDMPDRIAAGFKRGGVHGAITAALSDVIPPTPPGEHDALFRPQWLGELWQAVRLSRPIIEALGVKPLTSYRVEGFTWERPAFGVAPYTGNKTAVPSPGTFKIVPASATAQRVAGAHDVDRIFLDLGDGSFIRSYFEMQAENYAALSESIAASTLLAAATVLPAELTVLEALNAAAVSLGQLGASISFLKVAPDLWSQLIAISAADAPWLYGGTANLVNGTATVGGLTLASEPSLPAGTLLAGDRRAATYWEHKNPPLQLEAVNIANGGVDLGVFGYLAMLVNDARAVVTVTVAAGP